MTTRGEENPGVILRRKGRERSRIFISLTFQVTLLPFPLFPLCHHYPNNCQAATLHHAPTPKYGSCVYKSTIWMPTRASTNTGSQTCRDSFCHSPRLHPAVAAARSGRTIKTRSAWPCVDNTKTAANARFARQKSPVDCFVGACGGPLKLVVVAQSAELLSRRKGRGGLSAVQYMSNGRCYAREGRKASML